MLEAPYSQIETRMIHLTALSAAPLAVAASTRTAFIWTVTVPQNEQWQLIGVGGVVTFDSGQLTGGNSIGSITSARWGGRILYFPLQVVNYVGAFQAFASLLLPGLVAAPGDVVRINLECVNADAALPHNVSAEQADGLVLPIRLTANIALARRLEPNAQAELDSLLRR
jgi:hypothetical protein